MIRLAGEPLVSRRLDPAHSQGIDRVHRLVERCPRLDLDNDHDIAPPCDQVDFA